MKSQTASNQHRFQAYTRHDGTFRLNEEGRWLGDFESGEHALETMRERLVSRSLRPKLAVFTRQQVLDSVIYHDGDLNWRPLTDRDMGCFLSK